MTKVWGSLIVVVVVAATVASVSVAAQGRRGHRLWHGTPIQNLDAGHHQAFAADSAQRLTPQQPGQTTQLSNERTHTLWANPSHLTPIYASPNRTSRHVGRLHWRTEDGFPEVYLLLREYLDSSGHHWVELRIPARPNGQTGWVQRYALRSFGISRWLLVVNRHTEHLTAYHNGRRVFYAPVGVGKPSTPTPAGHFWIRERFRILDSSSPYFPYALGTSDYSTLSDWPGGGVVGIHGAWGKPWLIPGDPSHGCIRMHNNDDGWLAPRVPLGTPLHVI
jgi:hypothetical protein